MDETLPDWPAHRAAVSPHHPALLTGGRGENVYPAEVEQVLLVHPDVAEADVVGAGCAAANLRHASVSLLYPKQPPPVNERLATKP